MKVFSKCISYHRLDGCKLLDIKVHATLFFIQYLLLSVPLFYKYLLSAY